MDITALSQIVFGVVGGLGLFLLGMKSMSEGMQAVAGSGLRRMISLVTTNRFLAVGVGTVVTCVVQSSSITTVMVVGFVNSGLMQLSQAVGVIVGANVGTTITGWILVLKIGKYGLPLLGASAFVYLFIKSDRWRYTAMSLMGVGMVFFGLELMKDACALVKQTPEFEAAFQQFQADNYLGVLGCIAVGCLLTLVVQSSSATLGITISLAFQGVITFPTAAALVLGENIGTTITAYLASLGTTTNARRAAYFHVIFNLGGVAWITVLFFAYIQFIPWMLQTDVTKAVVENGQTVYPNTTAAIAASHSVFNIANAILFLPFLRLFVRLLERIVPAKSYKEKPHLTDLDIRILETPLLAIEQSRKEILKMGDGCLKMMGWFQEVLTQETPDKQLIDRLRHREQVLDTVQEEIAVFVTGLFSDSLPHAVAEEARQQLRMAHEYESISDYVTSLLKLDQGLRKKDQRFSERQRGDLQQLHAAVTGFLQSVQDANRQQNRHILPKLAAPRKEIREMLKRLQREQLEKLSAESHSPQTLVGYMAALNAYSRIRNHSQNVAEAIAGEK